MLKRILAVLISIITLYVSFLFLSMRPRITSTTIVLSGKDLEDSIFIQGMRGCENLYCDGKSMQVYVTDLSGKIHKLDGRSYRDLKIIKSGDFGLNYCLGIDEGNDGFLYVAMSKGEEWLGRGGAVYRVDRNLSRAEKISEHIRAINGLCCDVRGRIYIASGNLNPFFPKGYIHSLSPAGPGKMGESRLVISGLKSGNGLYYHDEKDLIYATEMFGSTLAVNPDTGEKVTVVEKSLWKEGNDDLCVSSDGSVWVADPGSSSIKRFIPGSNGVIRYIIEGLGQVSSCRTRMERGREIMYIAELKQTNDIFSMDFNGRGILAIPVKDLAMPAIVKSKQD